MTVTLDKLLSGRLFNPANPVHRRAFLLENVDLDPVDRRRRSLEALQRGYRRAWFDPDAADLRAWLLDGVAFFVRRPPGYVAPPE